MSNKQSYDLLFKVLIIGESGVGKTAIMQRCYYDSFDPVYISTIGVDFKPKIINVNGKNVKMQIWDTAGQERFKNITQQYYRGSQGVLIVYDITNLDSFIKIKNWFVELKEKTQESLPTIFIIGNKNDLKDRSVVTEDKVKELLQELGVNVHLLCSAKSGEGVNEIFEKLVLAMMEKSKPETKEKVEVIQNNGNNTGGCC